MTYLVIQEVPRIVIRRNTLNKAPAHVIENGVKLGENWRVTLGNPPNIEDTMALLGQLSSAYLI